MQGVLGFIVPPARLEPPQEPPFRIELPVVFREAADHKMLTDFMYGHDNIASPINFSLYVQAVNMQSVQSKLTAYGVHASVSRDGPWKPLMRIPVGNGKQFLVTDRARQQTKVFRPKQYLESMGNEVFAPRKTREGWAFFERRDVDPSEIKFFRFHMRDTAGAEVTQIVALPKEQFGRLGNDEASLWTFRRRKLDRLRKTRAERAGEISKGWLNVRSSTWASE